MAIAYEAPGLGNLGSYSAYFMVLAPSFRDAVRAACHAHGRIKDIVNTDIA